MFGGSAFGESAFGSIPEEFTYTVSATETKEGKRRLRAYYEALGRFVDRFAPVETAVTLTLWHYAKTEQAVAKIVFAGAKIEASSTYIKQLADAFGATQELRDDLTNVLQQLGVINAVRNQVLHYGATSIAEGNAIVSNALKAKGEPNVFPISPNLLDQMIIDLNKIIVHLEHRHVGREAAGPGDEMYIQTTFLAPWQYKHPALSKEPPRGQAHPKARKRGLKQPPPPRSSRA